jgi:hypothetical protein
LTRFARPVTRPRSRPRRAVRRTRPRRHRRLVDSGGRPRSRRKAGVYGAAQAVVVMKAGQAVTVCCAVAVLSVTRTYTICWGIKYIEESGEQSTVVFALIVTAGWCSNPPPPPHTDTLTYRFRNN